MAFLGCSRQPAARQFHIEPAGYQINQSIPMPAWLLDFPSGKTHVPLMHELGIAESALNVALAEAKGAGASRVLRIVIRVGALSGVDPEALRFAFDAILPGTAAEGATVQIDSISAVAYCPDCQQDFTPDTHLFLECPLCSRLCATIKKGRELDLVRLEMI
jgi:hydrogenase nickel incorporation protein HypA/HybF